MKTRMTTIIVAISGALLLSVFAAMTVTIVANAGHARSATERLAHLEHKLARLTDMRATLWSVQRVRNEIIETGRVGLLAEFDERLSNAVAAENELLKVDNGGDSSGAAPGQGGDETAARLQDMRSFSAALSSKSDARSAALFVIAAGRDARYTLIDALNLNSQAIEEVQQEMHRFTLGEIQSGEAMAFWWLLIGGNALMVVIIATAGLFAFLENERRCAAIAQADALERISVADISRSRFLAAASHDLRQPLHAVMLFVTVLRRRVGDAYVTSLIDGVASAVTSLERMFNTLLDVAKLDAGVVAAERTDFPVNHLVRSLEAEFGPLAQSKGLVLHGFGDEAIIHTDPVLLESMVRNIVANAIKYTSEGHVSVVCRPEPNGRFMSIEVSDTGPGIPDAEREEIFEEFYRSSSSSDDVEGLGLGLSIVRRLSILLNVSVSVQSIVGVGSTFVLRVPIAGNVPPALMELPAPPQHLRGSETHILLLDDNRLVREALSAELRDSGITVTTMRSAEEALTFLSYPENQAVFDGAIIDFSLNSGCNGVELLDRIAAHYGIALPALIMTGETDPDILEELGDSGYTWLQKPVEASVLIDALARLIAALDHEAPTDLLSAVEHFPQH